MPTNKFFHWTDGVAIVAIVVLALSLVWLLGGCSVTVHPKIIPSSGPSYSGDVANSGVLVEAADGSFVVEADFVARYDALVARFGKLTSILPGVGIMPGPAAGQFVVTGEVMADKIFLETLARSNLTP